MSSFARQLKSGTIRLRVEGDKEFVVHRALLRDLANVPISAHQRYIDFTGDEDTVGYLLEYLYTGDYTAEPRSHTTPHSNAGRISNKPHDRQHEHSLDDDEDTRLTHPVVIGARTSPLGVWGRPGAVHTRYLEESRGAIDDSHGLPTVKYVETSAISTSLAGAAAGSAAEDQAIDDTASTFLVHARVYLLAERHGSAGLQSLALQKLRAVMKTTDVEADSDRTAKLVPLIKMVYRLEPVGTGAGADAGADTVQQLRDVVVEQAVGHLAELQKGDHFKAFVRDGGAFVDDLLSRLARNGLSLRG